MAGRDTSSESEALNELDGVCKSMMQCCVNSLKVYSQNYASCNTVTKLQMKEIILRPRTKKSHVSCEIDR